MRRPSSQVLEKIAGEDYKSIAVCLLHAYAAPAHEKAIGARLAKRIPAAAVSLSSDVSPKYREYERASTVVANAYIKPIVSRYVSRLAGALKQQGIASDLFIMQSNGGLVSAELACDMPIRIVESGPAAGVLLSGAIGKEEGFDRVLTFDMGGTTAKLGAVDGGEPAITPTFEVDQVRYRKGSGLPINVPAVELLEIGAGGGSIAHTDMGLIKVGPESAGADPGPVCYGRGGEKPTVTDANVVLGYINPDYFNGGAMRLDAQAAADAVAAPHRRSARARRGRSGLGHPHARQRQHGAGHAHRLHRARARSAQVCAGGVRRRRPAARGAPGAGARHPQDRRAVRRRRRLGHRHAGGRFQARCLHDARIEADRRSREPDRRHLRPAAGPSRCAT